VISDLRLDDGFSRGDLFAVIDAFHGVNPGDASHVRATTLPFTAGTQQGQDVLYLKHPDADPVLAALRDFSGGSASTPSAGSASLPAPSSVRVRVLNASGASGAAARTLAVLQRHGFVAAGTGNNPRGLLSSTEVRARGSSTGAARLVASYAPSARLVTDDTIAGADVVLVLGRGFPGLSVPSPPSAPAPSTAGKATPAPAAPQPASLAPVPGPC
jgi:hypothetical protein